MKLSIEIIYEDLNKVIINKPALLDSQNSKPDRPSVVNWLEDKYKFSGLIHRLDFGTSGIMVCAKNSKSAKELTDLFQNHSMKKIYLALVLGQPSPSGIIESPVDEKPALTKYETLELFINASLVRVELVSGRKHQIRKHFLELGCPILGDHLYKKGGSQLLLKRPALHSFEIVMQGKTFQAPLPSDIEELLQRLRKRKADFNP